MEWIQEGLFPDLITSSLLKLFLPESKVLRTVSDSTRNVGKFILAIVIQADLISSVFNAIEVPIYRLLFQIIKPTQD
jgi:hypothetical protein